MTSLTGMLTAVLVALAVGIAIGPPRRGMAGGPGRDRAAPHLRRSRAWRRPRAAMQPVPVPVLFDLVAAVLDAGSAPGAAARTVALALDADDGRRPALLAIASAAGSPPDDVGAMSGPPSPGRWAGPTDETSGATADLAGLAVALRLAWSAGLPPADLVRHAAADQRRRASASRLRAVRRLEVLVVLPVGLCLLPAFVLVGVVPVVIDLVRGV